MTVKVFLDTPEDAAKINEVIKGELDLENCTIDLEIECPHEAERQIREEVPVTKYSVAVVE
jgi:hypothetical protein